MKLDIDCFEEVFDYLSFADLISVSKTCKRLYRVAGYCFGENYLSNTVCSEFHKGIFNRNLNLNHFVPFIREMTIYRSGFKYFFDFRSKFHQLKRINYIDNDVNRLKELPSGKLEVLCVQSCELESNFYEVIDHFPKLKRLHVEMGTNRAAEKWLNRKYPTLEYLGIVDLSLYESSIESISTVLELNPNIQEFQTCSYIFMEIRDTISSANIKLNILTIHVGRWNSKDSKNDPLCELLNELHERGFYQKLHLRLGNVPCNQQNVIDRPASVKGLTRLSSYFNNKPFSFAPLKNLEELCHRLAHNAPPGVCETMANDLINLKRIYFGGASMNTITALTRRSAKLREIILLNILEGSKNTDTCVINLLALNREREHLADAQKIQCCQREDIQCCQREDLFGYKMGIG